MSDSEAIRYHHCPDGLYIDAEGTPREATFGGTILTREDWNSIKAVAEKFFLTHSDEDITHMSLESDEQLSNYHSIPPKQKRIIHSGFVYLLKERNGNHYKIGKTTNPEDRIKLFSVKLPFKVDLLLTIPCDDYVKAETIMHDAFASDKIDGEWFVLSDNSVSYIKSISNFTNGSFHQ